MTTAIVASAPERVRFYDLFAWLYDSVVASELYHRVMWGMAPGEHAAFARRALATSAEGPILDAGCGSLLFTSRCYRESLQRLTLLDGSEGMLARARRRLGDASSEPSWVQADLRALPFANASFATVFHFGVLHCIDEADRVLGELARTTTVGGKLFLSCLTLARPRGDAFLRRLWRAGHVASPRTAEEVRSAVERAGFTLLGVTQRGSFSFIVAERA